MTAPIITGRTPESAEDIEAIRQIRNAGREWMTGSTAYITEDDQAIWWDRMRNNPRRRFCPILYVDQAGESVGYGLITRRVPVTAWASLGVRLDRRRQGIGTEIYRDLACRANGPLYAEIRRDNMASLRAAQKAGFVTLYSPTMTETVVLGHMGQQTA